MFTRTDFTRIVIGLILGLMLGVVLQQSNTRSDTLYAGLLSQGAFGALGSSAGTQTCCAPGGTCVLAGTVCAEGATVYNGNTCGGLAGGLGQPCATIASSESWCVGDDDGDGLCDDDPAHVCCNGVCQLPDMCPSSSSAAAYCCSFDGAGCIQAPGGDPGNDACDQNKTGYADATCEGACSSSSAASEQWCCEHVLPAGPANCYQL